MPAGLKRYYGKGQIQGQVFRATQPTRPISDLR